MFWVFSIYNFLSILADRFDNIWFHLKLMLRLIINIKTVTQTIKVFPRKSSIIKHYKNHYKLLCSVFIHIYDQEFGKKPLSKMSQMMSTTTLQLMDMIVIGSTCHFLGMISMGDTVYSWDLANKILPHKSWRLDSR